MVNVPTHLTVKNLLRKKLFTPRGPLLIRDLVVTYFYINIQHTFTGITKPRGTSVYLKVGHTRSHMSSLRYVFKMEILKESI